jgi:hypothetical protein
VSIAQKVQRLELSSFLLRMLQVGTENLIESWLYYGTHHQSIWLPFGEKPAKRSRVTVQCNRLIATIVWNSTAHRVMSLF